MFQSIAKYLGLHAPKSLFALIRERRAPAQGTERLYILDVDFPLTEESAASIDASLDRLRSKYGVDFFVLEPGFKLRRFSDV